MRSISDYFAFTSSNAEGCVINRDSPQKPATDAGVDVPDYQTFLETIAQLNYRNNDYQLFYRGQQKDHKTNTTGEEGRSSKLYTSIFRNDIRLKLSTISAAELVKRRFEILRECDDKLLAMANQSKFGQFGEEIKKSSLLRASLLQHYEVCDTPLLDVSSSPEVALSFALENTNDSAFIYVIALPQIVGTVTTSLESGLQIVRLMQFCPPDFLRPHFQHGYLVGEYPEVIEYSSKLGTGYKGHFNFKHRLLTKIRIPSARAFLISGFNPISPKILRPEESKLSGAFDELRKVAQPFQESLQQEINTTH